MDHEFELAFNLLDEAASTPQRVRSNSSGRQGSLSAVQVSAS